MSYIDWTVGKITVEIPGASAIFFKYKINFCCDGNKLLSEILQKKPEEKQNILNELDQLSVRKEQLIDYDSQSNQELISHILERYHEVHRQQIAELQCLSAKVEIVHADHPLCPKGLTEHLATMEAELTQHMYKEEHILFPMLSHDFNPMVSGPITVMRMEHDSHLSQIRKIYELANDVIPHEGACNTWRALYLSLQEFISDLNQHIHIENNILFNRAGV